MLYNHTSWSEIKKIDQSSFFVLQWNELLQFIQISSLIFMNDLNVQYMDTLTQNHAAPEVIKLYHQTKFEVCVCFALHYWNSLVHVQTANQLINIYEHANIHVNISH